MYSEQKYTNIFDVDREFFIITSDTLEMVESRFYGYGITADGRVILEISALTEGGN